MKQVKIFSFGANLLEEQTKLINEFLLEAVDPVITTRTCTGVNEYGHTFVNITVTVVVELPKL